MTTMYENIKNNDYSILVTGATGFTTSSKTKRTCNPTSKRTNGNCL